MCIRPAHFFILSTDDVFPQPADLNKMSGTEFSISSSGNSGVFLELADQQMYTGAQQAQRVQAQPCLC